MIGLDAPPGPFGCPAGLSLTVSCVMGAPAGVAELGDRLATVAAGMRRDRVGAVVVMDGRRLAGILTERDLLLAVADGLSTDMTPVSSYLRRAPETVRPDATGSDAVRRMIRHGVRH